VTVLSNTTIAPSNLVKLSDVAELIRGVTYKKEQARETPGQGYLPILRANNIQDSTLNVESELVYVPEDNVSGAQRLRAGDIVVATSSGSKHLVGKSAIVLRSWSGSFGAFCAAIRPKSSIDARYLAAYLQSPSYWKVIREKALGVNINNLRRGDLEELDVPLPSLEAQQDIAAEIEKQFSRLDEAVANLKRVKANLKRYKAAVLKAAVEGRLVPTEAELARKEGRDYKTGEQLLKRVLETRRKEWNGKGKYKEPAMPDVSKVPAAPNGWAWVCVETLAFVTKLAGFEYTKYVKYDELGDLAVLKAENAGPDGFRRTSFSRVRAASIAHLTRSKLKPGDLLMVFVGAGTGKVACVPDDQPYFLGPNISMIRIESALADSKFLEHYLRSPIGFSLALGYAKAVAQPSLSMGTIRVIPVPLPPLLEQQRIVAEVERRLSLITEVEAQADANLKRAERMRQAILAKSFRN
jgi:type I restriction enzyme S subunit